MIRWITSCILYRPEKNEIIIRQVSMIINLKGERTEMLEMRSHIAWYIKGLRDATYTKQKFFKLTYEEETIGLLQSFLLRQ